MLKVKAMQPWGIDAEDYYTLRDKVAEFVHHCSNTAPAEEQDVDEFTEGLEVKAQLEQDILKAAIVVVYGEEVYKEVFEDDET